MKIGDVIRAVKRIEGVKEDSEFAHELEARLWREVLIAISKGADNPDRLAKEALRSEEIDFPRWMS